MNNLKFSLIIASALVCCFISMSSCGGSGSGVESGLRRSSEEGLILSVTNDSTRVSITDISIISSDGGVESVITSSGTQEDEDREVLELNTSSGKSVKLTTRKLSSEIVRVEIEAPQNTSSFQVGIKLSEDELIYGLTERLRDSSVLRPQLHGPMVEDLNPVEFGTLNRRGEVVEMFVRPTMSLYAPFYHSSKGYGLWVEGSTPGSFDIGVQEKSVLRFSFESRQADNPKNIVFYILLGPEHKDILRQYHTLSGFPIKFPKFAFKHWRWRDSLPKGSFSELDGAPVNAKIAEDVLMYERFGIPFGVYLFDRPYLLGSNDPNSGGFGAFVWDESRIPNPEHTLNSLRKRGMEVATWITSWALEQNGQEAQSLGYLAPGNSRVIDLTNPAAFSWWRDRLSGFFSTWGIQGVKLDRGEEFVPSESSDIWHDGRNGRELHNEFPVLQSKVVHDALQAVHGDNSAVFARAAYSGSQRFVGHWGGDTPGQSALGLRMAIIQLQRAAFLGYPTWGSDTGGFVEFSDREVFARWLQFSALCPIMEIGGQGNHAPWNMPSEPRVDEELIEIYRRYVILHHSLIEYSTELAEQAHMTGTPIARPMIIEFPKDSRFFDRWDQYMYGPDLLVAPIWRVAERSREVLIPEGQWEWYWDRTQLFKGPGSILVDAPLNTLPLFVRSGSSF